MNANWVQDELLLALDLYLRVGLADASHPEVIELSQFLQSLPIHPIDSRSSGFRSPSSVALKLANLANHDPAFYGEPTHGAKADEEVWKLWADRKPELRKAAISLRQVMLQGSAPAVDDLEESIEVPEGRVLFREHVVRERNKKLRERKIREALDATGVIECEVCNFNFLKFYGERGRGYIESHHIVPLHLLGETKTRLEDLALICSNCHRMIHRSKPWLTPAELRKILNTN